MRVTAQLQPAAGASANRRYAPRRTLRLGSLLSEKGAPAIIRDLSVTGLLVQTDDLFAPGEEFLFELPENGPTKAKVIWQDGDLFGCEFLQPVSRSCISAALLQGAAEHSAIVNGRSEERDHGRLLSCPEEDLEPYPLAIRLLLIVSASLGLWALIGLCLALLT